ncbi:MAG: thiamine-phosphate kinase [Gammaproteobacteria bacterium]|nr:thiamine-phosphate kinase [Gammaproteobacteria bacterium]MCP4088909.1 thiamine-phosphate kinase [Gammaproteobacteria bacterium]MCP4274925.1 thiamine-phosphate kinase [Gammaproteobacteria bacterium]MCP4929443.1 thiamine-phosphate kinase [Gammaproteobacteria bacterium]
MTEQPTISDPASLREFCLIEKLFARRARSRLRADVSIGIGDDAAVTRFSPDNPGEADLVTATDMLSEGTHFLPETPAHSVGHRCLAVNLSDIAAMGATPLWASMALSLPAVDEQWLNEFADGFFALADACGVELIGGDTVRGPLSVAVTVQGSVPCAQAVLRSGAQTGDLLYVTGEPGAAAAGRLLLAEAEELPASTQALANKFMYPEPRLQVGLELRPLVNAMIDISDGLHADLKHLLAASSKGAALDVDKLCLHAGVESGFSRAQAIELAMCGGEDYELLFAVSPRNVAQVHKLAKGWSCRLACIGVVTESAQVEWRQGEESYAIPDSGYRHF